jgi:hypothetical protein
MPRSLASIVLCLAACGGSHSGSAEPDASALAADAPGSQPADAAGGGDGSGTGTSTLLVNGVVSASPSINNSSNPADFTTDFSVAVTKATVAVTTGTITMTSTAGAVSLIFDTTTMRWHGAQAGYVGSYTLDVTSGTDAVNAVRVAGPDIHTFTAPLEGATVDSTMVLAVDWVRTGAADAATIRTRALNALMIPDTAAYTLPIGSLRSKPDQTENEQIDLVRVDHIAPGGAVAGSDFQVSVRNSVDLVVSPTN